MNEMIDTYFKGETDLLKELTSNEDV